VSRGHEDVVALLIKHGAKVNIEEIHGMMPFSVKLFTFYIEINAALHKCLGFYKIKFANYDQYLYSDSAGVCQTVWVH
jgi:hypothetical protein